MTYYTIPRVSNNGWKTSQACFATSIVTTGSYLANDGAENEKSDHSECVYVSTLLFALGAIMQHVQNESSRCHFNYSSVDVSAQSSFNSNYVLTDDANYVRHPAKLDSILSCPPFCEGAWSQIHAYCGITVNHPHFQGVVLLFIVLNSIIMAIATFDFVTENPPVDNAFEVMDTFFLTIFSVELFLHLIFYGSSFFLDKWLVFDFTAVCLSWAFQALAVFRAFRVVRAFRVITKMKDMRDLVGALLNVLPRMFAILLLLLLIYFVFAVMFTEMFKTAYVEGYTSQDYFSRLDKTAFTLLQFMFLDSWSSITKELMQKYWWAWIPVLIFIVISTFIVMNLIIAVICDAVAMIHSKEMTKQVDEMQHITANAMEHNEAHHREEIARLESKIDQLSSLLAAVITTHEACKTPNDENRR